MPLRKTIKRLVTLLTVLLVLLVFAYVTTFAISNSARVDLNLVFLQLQQLPVELLVIVSFVLGAFSGLLAASVLLYRAYAKQRQLMRQYTRHIG